MMETSLTKQRSRLWRLLIPLGVGTVLALTGDLTLYAVLPAYASGASSAVFSLATIGLLLSANRLVRLLSNPLVGVLLAGHQRRGFVLTGFGLGACSTLLYVVARGTGVFLAGRLLWGISWSLIYIGGYTMLLDIAEEQDRGWGSGILQGFYFAGLALDPFLGGLLSDRFGFAISLSICAALSAAGFVMVLLTLPETLPSGQTTRASLGQALRGILLDWERRLPALRALIHRQNAALFFIYFTANFVGDGILLSTLSLYLKEHTSSAFNLAGWALPVASAGGALLAWRAIISALFAPLAGSLTDRPGQTGAAGSHDLAAARWMGVAVGLLAAAVGLGMLIWQSTPGGLVLGVSLAAAGGAAILTLAPPLVGDLNPSQESAALLGLLASSADLGLALAPLATYALLDRLPLEMIYTLAAIMLVTGLPLVWLARRR
jgi:MFS family permease